MLPGICRISLYVDTLKFQGTCGYPKQFRVSIDTLKYFRVSTDTLKFGFKNSTDTLKWYTEYHNLYYLCNLRHISYILNL